MFFSLNESILLSVDFSFLRNILFAFCLKGNSIWNYIFINKKLYLSIHSNLSIFMKTFPLIFRFLCLIIFFFFRILSNQFDIYQNYLFAFFSFFFSFIYWQKRFSIPIILFSFFSFFFHSSVDELFKGRTEKKLNSFK